MKIDDPLLTNIELPLSEMEAQLLIIALKELPDDAEGMKELLMERDCAKTESLDVLAHSNVMFKEMLLHRISANALKNNPIPKILEGLFDDTEYDEV